MLIPPGWNIAHESMRHWSTKDTLLEYTKSLDPYMERQRKQLDLLPTALGLCIFYVFAAHRRDEFLQRLGEHNIMVPASHAGQLQPLNLAINKPFKNHFKELLSLWYAEKVKESKI